MATDITTTEEISNEALKQKIKELGYLVPPSIEGRPGTYEYNDRVPAVEPEPKFAHLEAAEHEETARAVELFDIHGQKLPVDERLVTADLEREKIDLNFGNIIALAGDFYTCREGTDAYYPISDAQGFGTLLHPTPSKDPLGRFDAAVDSLMQNTDGYLNKVKELIASEHHALHAAVTRGHSTAAAYHEKAQYNDGDFDHCRIPTDKDFITPTRTGLTDASSVYAWIAYTNVDHFGEHAVMAYCVGHTSALKLARSARGQTSDGAQMALLRAAYAHDAFAAHFLTDLFSSGHLRAPRQPLHNSNYIRMGLDGWRDVPVWDFQCRYMHDDDSATGILVCNQNGDQWIEYGDKQFMEPQACVNRARCLDCLKASAAEVYRIGYQSNRPIEDWDKNKSWFAAMKLLPQPMTAITPQTWTSEWGGYDMHNPAPLWLSSHAKVDDASGWTVRKDLNDHSNFGRREFMSPDSSDHGFQISRSSFVKEGQFPVQLAIDGLLSGGFLQIQDLNAGAGKGTCVNFWSPATVKFLDKTESTFTLRNRLIDQDIAPAGEVMHWMRAPGDGTAILGFSWTKNDDKTGSILMKITGYSSSSDYHGPSDGTSALFSTKQSWAMSQLLTGDATILTGDATILTGVDYDYVNWTRFVKGFFISDIKVAAVCQYEGKALIGLSGEYSTQGQINLPEAPYGFVKAFNGANSAKHSILLARAGPKEGSKWVNLAKVDFDEAGKMSVQTADFDLDLTTEQDASVLVGDTLGLGHDQVIAITPTSDTATVAVYGQAVGESELKPRGLHQCTISSDMELVCPILTALVPSISSSGQDLLHISRHKSGNNSYLTFHTHLHRDDAEDPFYNCYEANVPDPLATSSPDHFFSLKWMPVRLENKDFVRGILEVFSWYGVLGVRVFVSKDGFKYDLLGQLPQLGQTSIGAGLGCYGDWGHGFVTWAAENEWTDANLFHPSSKQDMKAGSWGMVWDDKSRSPVRGWDVEQRPLR